MPVWEEILVGWLFMFILPKAVFVPVFHAMWRAMKATDEQDRLDEIWLAEYQAGHGNGGGNDPVPAYRRRQPPRPPRTPGGRRGGAARKTRSRS
jgi:hypothetical protein